MYFDIFMYIKKQSEAIPSFVIRNSLFDIRYLMNSRSKIIKCTIRK
jgi:hypothetical protein